MLYKIITYGCQMNVHDSEKLSGQLVMRGYAETEDSGSADILVFNTCCIRDTAELKALGNIIAAKKYKEKKPSVIIAVGGCMPQKNDSLLALKKRCPHVDIIFGTHNAHKFGEMLDECLAFRSPRYDVLESTTEIVENSPVSRTSGTNAWVNIMYGCNNFCSYCIVPYVRGRERSRQPEDIINEIKRLVLDEGYYEITLLGQNVNSYSPKAGYDFSDLIADIEKIPATFRIKFMTSHPKDLSFKLVDVIRDSGKAAKFIHFPAQSGSDKILEKMNRRYTASDYRGKIEYIRKQIPGCGISGDIIAGFPGETDQDFCDTLSLVSDIRFNNLYMFIYSKREGTPAFSMEGQVSSEVKKARISELIKLQRKITAEYAKEAIGKTYRCLISPGDTLFATSDCGKLIFLPSHGTSGFQNVLITGAKSGRLLGDISQ